MQIEQKMRSDLGEKETNKLADYFLQSLHKPETVHQKDKCDLLPFSDRFNFGAIGGILGFFIFVVSQAPFTFTDTVQLAVFLIIRGVIMAGLGGVNGLFADSNRPAEAVYRGLASAVIFALFVVAVNR